MPTLATGSARAQDVDAQALDTARTELEEARFEEALATLEALEGSSRLDLGALSSLLELRAIAQFALGDADAVALTVRALASIDPTHAWSGAAPPDLRALFEQLAPETPRVALSLRIDTSDVQLTLSLDVIDPALLVRATELYVDRGAGFEAVRAPLGLPLDADVRAYARALGPGAALLAGAGSEREPQRVRRGGAAREGDGVDPWPFVVAGLGAAVVGAAVAIIVFFATQPGTTQPSSPVLR